MQWIAESFKEYVCSLVASSDKRFEIALEPGMLLNSAVTSCFVIEYGLWLQRGCRWHFPETGLEPRNRLLWSVRNGSKSWFQRGISARTPERLADRERSRLFPRFCFVPPIDTAFPAWSRKFWSFQKKAPIPGKIDKLMWEFPARECRWRPRCQAVETAIQIQTSV